MNGNAMTRPTPALGANVSDDILACKILGHHWSKPQRSYTRGEGYYILSCKCSRCGADRDQYVSAVTGAKIAPVYRLPPGYSQRGQGRLTAGQKNVLRLEIIQKLPRVARGNA